MSGDEDKGFFGNLFDDVFGDDEDEEKDPGSPGDGGSGGSGGSGGASSVGNDGAEGASSDDGSGQRAPEEELPIEDGEEEGFGTRTTEADDSDGTAGVDNLGKSASGLGVLLDTLGATDIALWPHAVIQLIDVALDGKLDLPATPVVGEHEYEVRLHYGLQDWNKANKLFGTFNPSWAKVTLDAGIDLDGVWKPASKDEAPGKPAYDRGLSLAVELWAKDTSWIEQSGEIQWGVPLHNDESHNEDSVALAFQYEVKFIFRKGSKLELPVDLKIVFNAIEFERTKGSTIWNRAGVAKIEATLTCSAGSKYVTFEGPYGEFKGTIGIYGEAEVEPNYEKILKLAIEKWGQNLAIDTGTLLTLPVVTVVGGVLGVVWGIRELLDAWSMEDLRDKVVPQCTNAGTQGYMDGLRGKSEGNSGASATDPDTARDAYAAAGYKKRLELITSKCNNDADAFTRWVNEHSAEIEKQTRGQINVLVKKQLWAAKAADYAGALVTNKGQALTNQYYAWVAVIGNSPKAKGGEWLDLWLKHRTFAPDFKERSAGDW
jgi:hypothetical protein